MGTGIKIIREDPIVRPVIDETSLCGMFPILRTCVRGRPLVYLDNAATTQKPQCVIDTITRYYSQANANVHRGVHFLSEKATELFETARGDIGRFLGAPVSCETVFTHGATEAINLVAWGYGRSHLTRGDEVLITHLEHHSNIVPWQMLCKDVGATLRVVPMDDAGDIVMDEFDRLLNERTRIVAVAHVSNALGTVTPVRDICAKARRQGAVSLVDGAQSASRLPVDVRDMGADFFVCSGHKMYAPSGIGILVGRAALLESMNPFQSGGNMIRSVDFDATTFADFPQKFEAGTPNIEGAIGFGAAVRFLESLGMQAVAEHERHLLTYATVVLSKIEGLKIIGTARNKAGVLSFTLDGVHPHDVGQLLDSEGVAVRAGHHCAQPVMKFFGVPATVRASFGVYNTRADIDALAMGIQKVKEIFS